MAKTNKMIKKAARIKGLEIEKKNSIREIEFGKAIKPLLNASSTLKNTLNRL
jgi:hypothetical protein